jgi:probable rRNA maturation factor
MIDFDNQTNFKVDIKELEKIANYITNKDFELILVDNPTIQEINKEYRNIDKPTDVLSFPLDVVCEGMPIGSIIISIDFLDKALEYGHSKEDELKLLLIHGLLHLIGYDHEVDNGEMREKEKEIIEYFNLPNSLIIFDDKIALSIKSFPYISKSTSRAYHLIAQSTFHCNLQSPFKILTSSFFPLLSKIILNLSLLISKTGISKTTPVSGHIGKKGL